MPFARFLLMVLVAGCSDGGDSGDHDLAVNPDGGYDMAVAPGATHCSAASSPKLLSALPGLHRSPRLGFSGTGYVVAWNTEVATGHRIDLAIIDADGNRLGPNVSMTADAVADPSAPSVAPLEGGTVVAWSRITATGTHIYISSFDANGQKLDPNGVPCDPGQAECGLYPVTSAANEREPSLTRPTVAAHTALPTDNQIGLAWIGSVTGGSQVYWKKIQGNGKELIPDKQITVNAGKYELPRMAFDGTNQGISWRDDARTPTADFFFATLNGSGQISSQAMMVGSATGPYSMLSTPALIWSDGDYAMVAATGGSPSAAITLERFASNGVNLLPAHGVTFGGTPCTPTVAWDGEAYGIGWQTICGQPGSGMAFELVDKAGQRLSADGKVCPASEPVCGTTFLALNASTQQSDPEMVWAGSHSYAVVWTEIAQADGGAASSEVYFSRVDCM